MARVGVILSGCGVLDGSEIHESVLALLALDRAGAQALCFAPDAELEVVDHLRGEPTGERRNVLVEAARIARGQVRDLAEARIEELDALLLPGGYGAAKNLCDFESAGPRATVHPELARLLAEALRARKPILAICIAPAVLAAALRDSGVHPELTIGDDAGTAAALEAMGACHHACAVDELHVDREQRLISTPAYMLAGRIGEAATGIERAVAELLRIAD